MKVSRWVEVKKVLIREGREWKHVYIEDIFIEVLSAAASTLLVHFKKMSGRFFLPCRECFLISDVVRNVGVIILSSCCRHAKSLLEKSLGLHKGQPGDITMPCPRSQSRTCL